LYLKKKVWGVEKTHRKFHPATLSYQGHIPTVSCQGHIPANHTDEGVKIEAREVLQ
jgi:hypothetical protein